MIVTGSREWGEDRLIFGVISGILVERELQVSAAVAARLVARYVVGMKGQTSKRDRSSEVGEGLVIIDGGAPGLDTHFARAIRVLANGQRRTSREAFAQIWTEPHIAPGMWLEIYMADWKGRPRNMAGPERNQRMLDSGADQCVAFFAHGRSYGPDERGGTNDMVRRAHAAGVPVDIYEADHGRWRKP